jgi:hypothetical protein
VRAAEPGARRRRREPSRSAWLGGRPGVASPRHQAIETARVTDRARPDCVESRHNDRPPSTGKKQQSSPVVAASLQMCRLVVPDIRRVVPWCSPPVDRTLAIGARPVRQTYNNVDARPESHRIVRYRSSAYQPVHPASCVFGRKHRANAAQCHRASLASSLQRTRYRRPKNIGHRGSARLDGCAPGSKSAAVSCRFRSRGALS